MSEMKITDQIEMYEPVDGRFCLVFTADEPRRLLAETWSIHDARFIAGAQARIERLAEVCREVIGYAESRPYDGRIQRIAQAILAALG